MASNGPLHNRHLFASSLFSLRSLRFCSSIHSIARASTLLSIQDASNERMPSSLLPSAFLYARDRTLADVPRLSTPRYAASTIKRVNPADCREKTTVLLFKHALYNAECSPCVRSCLIDAGRSLHAAAILSRFYPRGMKARSHESIDPYIDLDTFHKNM